MADLLEAGEDRPRHRRGAVAVLLAVALVGYALTQHLSAPANPPAAAQRRTAQPTPTSTPTDAVNPPATVVLRPRPAPWASLPVGRRLDVDLAAGRVVRSGVRTTRLEPGARVITMNEAAAGPVLLVQSRGNTLLEQLRRDGDRVLLDAFPDESRHPQGVAVDPTGRLVAYALTAKPAEGPFGLVVRDLAAGVTVASRRTRMPFAVRDWTPGGVVLEVALDPGGPPYAWRPGAGPPVRVTPFGDEGGPFLLAASPVRAQWAVTEHDCTEMVSRLGQPPGRQLCPAPLTPPAAWAPAGARIVATRGHAVEVLDVRTGALVRLAVPNRVYVSQLVWERDDTVLVAVRTLTSLRSAVLRCVVGRGCRRAPAGPGVQVADLVLAT